MFGLWSCAGKGPEACGNLKFGWLPMYRDPLWTLMQIILRFGCRFGMNKPNSTC